MRLFVIANNFPTPANPENGVWNLRQLIELRKLGYQPNVVICVPYAPPFSPKWRRYAAIPSEYESEGIPVRTMRAVFFPRALALEYLRYQVGRILNEHVRRINPDIIQAHGLLPAGSLGVGLGKPVVVTSHGSETYDRPWSRRGLLLDAQRVTREANTMVAVSSFLASKLRSLGARNVHVIPNGADETVFRPAARVQARLALKLEQNRPVIAFAGNLVAQKGIFDLARAAERLSDIRPYLVFAGDGPERDRLSAALQRGVVDHVLFGSMRQESVAQLFAAADVVVLPSYKEGLGAVLCEAMLAERAIVASNAGGIPDLVLHEENGLLFAPGDDAALAAALRRILVDNALRDRFAAAGRAKALRSLTWRANALCYDSVYQQVVSHST